MTRRSSRARSAPPTASRAGLAERSIDDRLRYRPVRRGEGLDEIAFAPDEHAAEIGELAESFDAVVAAEAAGPDAPERERGQRSVDRGGVDARAS